MEQEAKLSKGQRRRRNKQAKAQTKVSRNAAAVPGSVAYAEAKEFKQDAHESVEEKDAVKYGEMFFRIGSTFSREYEAAVKRKDYKAARECQKAGAAYYQMAGIGSLSKPPKPKGLVAIERTVKNLPPIVPRYDKWVDDLNLIVYAFDLDFEEDPMELSFGDPNEPAIVDPFTKALNPYADTQLAATRQRMQICDKYRETLKQLPEVKEVQALFDKQIDPELKDVNPKLAATFVDELEGFFHSWRFVQGGEGGFILLSPKRGDKIEVIRDSSGRGEPETTMTMSRRDGSCSEDPALICGQFDVITGDALGALYSAKTKKEALEALKTLLEKGWFISTLTYLKLPTSLR